MQVDVLIEPIGKNGFRATSGVPIALSAEGGTRNEALAKLRELLLSKLTNGYELVTLEIPVGPAHPLLKDAGWLKDDPSYDEWRAAIDENRRREDEALGIS
jgi:hypothetical protein